MVSPTDGNSVTTAGGDESIGTSGTSGTIWTSGTTCGASVTGECVVSVTGSPIVTVGLGVTGSEEGEKDKLVVA